MKRFFIIFLTLALLCCGCSFGENTEEYPVQFYYLRDPDAFLYGAADGVVTYEDRDSSGHAGDMRYLLTLYLQGPLDENLRSPFPAGCSIVALSSKDSELTVALNSNFSTLQGMDLTLACVCLARTCMSLAEVDAVHILAKSADGKSTLSQTITIDSLLLEDTPVPTDAGA